MAGVTRRKRRKRSSPISNLVVISDTHCGCRFGLCPPNPVPLDGGGFYEPSRHQKIVWTWWEEFWHDWVPLATRGEPFAVVMNGDAIDGVHHNSVTQISHNLQDQVNIAYAVLAPIVELCEGRYYHLRGTEAHVGKSGQEEERLAQRLNAIPDDTGHHARYELWARVGHGLAHIMHHIGVAGSLHFESSAPMKELTESYVEAGRWGQEPPDWIVRCLSDDTELLTRRGWKNCDEYVYPEEVMTFCPLTGALVWQSPHGWTITDREPEMVHITGRGIDILVTPDHTMVAKPAGVGPWRLMQAADIVGEDVVIPISGSFRSRHPLADHEARLLGMLVANGEPMRNRSRGVKVTHRVSHTSEFERAARACGLPYTIEDLGQEATARLCIPDDYARSYLDMLSEDGSLRRELLDMSKSAFQAYLEGCMADNSGNSRDMVFSKNRTVLDQIQEMGVRHSYKTTLTRAMGDAGWVLTWAPDTATERLCSSLCKTELVYYAGRSWCVSVPNGTLITRRNGCVAIVGNSHRHRNIEVRVLTSKGFATAITTPAWQLRTPFAYRVAGARQAQPQIGGCLLRSGDEDLYTRSRVWTLSRSKEVEL